VAATSCLARQQDASVRLRMQDLGFCVPCAVCGVVVVNLCCLPAVFNCVTRCGVCTCVSRTVGLIDKPVLPGHGVGVGAACVAAILLRCTAGLYATRHSRRVLPDMCA
jgi:hypothetical protein